MAHPWLRRSGVLVAAALRGGVVHRELAAEAAAGARVGLRDLDRVLAGLEGLVDLERQRDRVAGGGGLGVDDGLAAGVRDAGRERGQAQGGGTGAGVRHGALDVLAAV